MDFKDVVMKRRSIRKYTDEPVSEEDLQYILECGMSAPSAVNLQPWYFVVIRSKEQMARLCEVMSDSSDKLSDDLHALFQVTPGGRGGDPVVPAQARRCSDRHPGIPPQTVLPQEG